MAEVSNFISMPDTILREKNTYMEYKHFGFTMEDFDRSGNISPWMIAKLFQLARACAFSHPDYFSHTIKLYHPDGPMGWTTIVQYDFNRDFYSRAKTRRYKFPMKLSTQLDKIGKSSLDFVSNVVDAHDDETLASLRFKYVLVDRDTRKSAPVPEHFKTAYEKYTSPNGGVGEVTFPIRPDNAYRMNYTIRPSDIDHNGHLNNAYYIRLCYDCATIAAMSKNILNFLHDVCDYSTKKITARYVGESRLDDGQLNVYCWEDHAQKKLLHFTIEKGQRVIYQSSILFYDTISYPAAKL